MQGNIFDNVNIKKKTMRSSGSATIINYNLLIKEKQTNGNTRSMKAQINEQQIFRKQGVHRAQACTQTSEFYKVITGPGSSVGSVRSGEWEVTGSIPGHDIPESLKMVLAALCLALVLTG